MSLSLLPSYTIELEPISVSVMKLQRTFPLFREKLIESSLYKCEKSSKSKAWHASLAILETQFAQFKIGTKINIVLSNHFMRYKIIPALPAFSKADQILDVATHCFKDVYGDKVDDWRIQVNPLPHGDSVIACAVDNDLLVKLEELEKKYRLTIKSIQPSLMYYFNAFRHQIKSRAACFVQLDTGRANVALIRDGSWLALASGLISENWQVDLASLIHREIFLTQWQDQQPIIYLVTIFTVKNMVFDVTLPSGLVCKVLHLNPTPEHATNTNAKLMKLNQV